MQQLHLIDRALYDDDLVNARRISNCDCCYDGLSKRLCKRF